MTGTRCLLLAVRGRGVAQPLVTLGPRVGSAGPASGRIRGAVIRSSQVHRLASPAFAPGAWRRLRSTSCCGKRRSRAIIDVPFHRRSDRRSPMSEQREVVILSGVRTAIGDYGGSLKDIAPSDLGGARHQGGGQPREGRPEGRRSVRARQRDPHRAARHVHFPARLRERRPAARHGRVDAQPLYAAAGCRRSSPRRSTSCWSNTCN